MNIILASGSPRRRNLLEQINLPFTVEASGARESYDPSDPPEKIATAIALRKALKVAENKRDVLVIGADTIVVFDGEILEKPGGSDDAAAMLAKLSDRTHRVITGVALVKMDDAGNISRKLTFFETTEVTFGKLGKTEIMEYVESGSPLDKAGSYGIQDDWGSVFVKKINGDYNNVVGFPLHSFYTTLKRFAPELIPHSIRLNYEQ